MYRSSSKHGRTDSFQKYIAGSTNDNFPGRDTPPCPVDVVDFVDTEVEQGPVVCPGVGAMDKGVDYYAEKGVDCLFVGEGEG